MPIDRSLPVAEVSRLLDVYGPTGAYLVALREARRLDLGGLSAATRIASRFIGAMEAENWGALPGATFVRGYLRMILRALEVPGTADEVEELVEGYMARFHRARG
ncbi:MAG: helix-turn-helix domain-containing protein [Deltaproteobacteria bacterium]|nr:helix-turn-helix domain-containing protein [Deltaproteobacteria bacterium]